MGLVVSLHAAEEEIAPVPAKTFLYAAALRVEGFLIYRLQHSSYISIAPVGYRFVMNLQVFVFQFNRLQFDQSIASMIRSLSTTM